MLKSVSKNKLCIFIFNFMMRSRFFKGLQGFFFFFFFLRWWLRSKTRKLKGLWGRVFVPSTKALRVSERRSTVIDTQVLINCSFLTFVFGSGNSNECLQNSGFEHTICFLPPLVLNFELPPDYPSSSPPSFTLSGKWLSPTQVRPEPNFSYPFLET